MSERELMTKLDNIRNNVINAIHPIEHQYILNGSPTLFTIKNLTVYRCYTSTRNLEEVRPVMEKFK